MESYNNYTKKKTPYYKKKNLKGQDLYNERLSQKNSEILENWRKEQDKLKEKLISMDDDELNYIRYVGGVDISFDKYDSKVGISALVVCDYKTLEIVYEDYELVTIDEPYIPGFLAFREVKHFVKLVNNLKENHPEYIPQVILVDGNGIFHIKGFGLACHLGVLTDLPAIGCGKTVFAVDGITKKSVEDINYNYLKKKGDSYPLNGYSGTKWGYALKSSDDVNEEPMIISMGHKITQDTALRIVKKTCIYRIPEPIRLADKISRRLIFARENYINKFHKNNWDLKRYLKEKNKYIHGKLYEDNE